MQPQHDNKKTIVGLTGGIASGKTVVANVWQSLGADVISADEIAKKLAENGGAALAPLKEAFPEAFQNGSLNRRLLREIIFYDEQKRKTLDAMMHPRIMDETLRRVQECRAQVVVIDAPLLFEAGFERLVDVTVCTMCSKKTQIQRLCTRDGCDETLAEQMIQAQMDTSQKSALCDYVLDTDMPLSELVEAAANMFLRLKGE